MTLLQAIRRLRRDYLDDLGGDRPEDNYWLLPDADLRWSNEQLTDFLNDSVAVYVRTVGLFDSDPGPGAVSWPVVAGQSVYDIPAHVISIEQLSLVVDGSEPRILDRIFHEEANRKGLSESSQVRWYETETYHRRLRLWGTPTADHESGILEARVKRLAMEEMTWDAATADQVTPEIVHPRDHHKLLPYAAYLAYSVEDEEADVNHPEKARSLFQLHLATVGELRSDHIQQWLVRNKANTRPRASPFGMT